MSAMPRLGRFPPPLRLFLPATLLVCAGAVVAVTFTREVTDAYRRVERRTAEAARLLGTMTASEIETGFRRGGLSAARASFGHVSADRRLRVAVLADEDGRVRLSTRYELEGRRLIGTRFAEHGAMVERARTALSSETALARDGSRLISAFPVQLVGEPGEGQLPHRGVLVMEHDLSFPKREALAEAVRHSLTTGLLLAGCIALTLLLFTRVLTGRARRLVQAADRVAAGELDVPFQLGGSDELAQVARSIEHMVTRMRESNLALAEREAQFRSLIEHGSDVIVVVEKDGSLSFASPSLERVLGWKPEQLVGAAAAALVHEDDRERARETVARALHHTSVGEPFEFRFRTASGEWRRLEAIATRPAGSEQLIISARDVTQREELGEQLRQAQKMEAVGRLAGGIAHDFNNLLTVIGSYGDLLLRALPPGDARRNDVAEIRKATDRASALTRQLLAFGRRQVLQPRIVSLNDTVTGMAEMLRRLLGVDVVLETTLDPSIGAVEADPGQLEQVLMNLAVNARDAMAQGGTLTVETANVTLRAGDPRLQRELPPGQYVALVVRDTGAGIAPEAMERLFEPFFTTKPVGQGTGLGLSTVYGIVRQSGGGIHVTSAPGHGARFEVLLPRLADATLMQRLRVDDTPRAMAAAQLAIDSEPSDEPLVARGETVLVAEDEPGVRDLAVRILGRLGYRVLAAANGREALEVARAFEGDIHLLLTDVVMPEINGIELSERLSEARPGVRVLFVSGYPNGAPGTPSVPGPLLQKPFTLATLGDRVRRTLDARIGARIDVRSDDATLRPALRLQK